MLQSINVRPATQKLYHRSVYLSDYQLPVFYHLSIQTSINSLSITYLSSAYLYNFIYTYTHVHTHISSFLQPSSFYESRNAMRLGGWKGGCGTELHSIGINILLL